ncbi:hypothetical protein A3841_01685 [Pontibacter flavimaris]|uniref:Uncharacterized protein n=1 Tax=Pontibacter flavimaris TaxID=1797110 RepID=A0A1Q5PAQ3_9BACT|nr:hypothetical protein A3841_01685 [Pontibacter flavimaris]
MYKGWGYTLAAAVAHRAAAGSGYRSGVWVLRVWESIKSSCVRGAAAAVRRYRMGVSIYFLWLLLWCSLIRSPGLFVSPACRKGPRALAAAADKFRMSPKFT